MTTQQQPAAATSLLTPGTALERARAAAFGPGEYAGQESFMSASEIRELAGAAGIGTATAVLDLCCGTAGPGRLITAETGCRYLGVDASAAALAAARAVAGDLGCQFGCQQVPPVPAGRFEVVLLLETLLAFQDKGLLARQVARALAPGGRFAFTVEEGAPLSAAERAQMPAADTVWPVGLAELTALLHAAGLTPCWQAELTAAHHAAAAALLAAYQAGADEISAAIGAGAAADLLASHELWRDWLGSGRVRKFAIVARPR